MRFHDSSIILSDEQFRQFVSSDALLKRAPAFEATLARWKSANLGGVAGRILPYLPSSAVVRARIYPAIKPGENSFVWEAATNPAIFRPAHRDAPAASRTPGQGRPPPIAALRR